jgi:uncharacterized coiled-coil protein SlyX
MRSYKSIAAEEIAKWRSRNAKTGMQTGVGDPTFNVYRLAEDQRSGALELRKETMAHLWASIDPKGKIILNQLDDRLPGIAARIEKLDQAATVNEGIVEELEKTFADLQIEPPISGIEARIGDLREKITFERHTLNEKLMPFRDAAAVAHVSVDSIPEAAQIKAEYEARIKVLESEIKDLEEKMKKIRAIAAKAARVD